MRLNDKQSLSPVQMSQTQDSAFEESSAAPKAGKPLCDRRILLVEDEVLLAMDIQFTLEDHGAEIVGPSNTVTEAAKLATAERLDAAILDVDLNGEEVFPVASKLKEAGVPFIFHTGHATREQLKALFPNVAVCHKPTASSDLLKVLCALFPD